MLPGAGAAGQWPNGTALRRAGAGSAGEEGGAQIGRPSLMHALSLVVLYARAGSPKLLASRDSSVCGERGRTQGFDA